MKRAAKVLAVAILFFVSVTGADAGSGNQTVLVPNDNIGTDFGRDIAVSGDTVLVGESSGGTGYIYEFENCAWVQKAALSMNDSGNTHHVALSDNFAIMGSGDSVYIFEKPDTGWADTNEGTVLIPDDFNAEEYYISDVNIHEKTIVAGCNSQNADIRTGYFYVFEFDGTEWNQTATVSADEFTNPGFGLRADIYGDRIIVSGKISLSGKNTSYIYKKGETGIWEREAELTDELDIPLQSLAITDGYAVVGGSGNSACIFKYTGYNWIFSQKIKGTPDERGYSGRFGLALDITPQYAVIGAPFYSAKDIPFSGAVFIYKNEEEIFVKKAVHTPQYPKNMGIFGWSAGISDDYFVAGQPRSDSAVIINLFLPGDLDRDGCVGKNDAAILRTYLNRPVGECPECDLDGDCKITILDARKLVGLCTNADCECP
ncbi:MAG: hypothetical protein R2941_11005 [Desulfobacterales bacterium]